MIHEGKERRTRGDDKKVLGCIQSQYAAFCVAFKLTHMDMGREISLFFCFVLTSPSLYSWNWRLENTAAPGILPTTSFSKSDLRLGSKPISGSALVFEDKIQNCFSTFRVFYFSVFQFQVTHQTWGSPQKYSLYLSSVWKIHPFTEMIPGIDAVKLYSNILCLITMYIWCLNSYSFVTMKQPRCR